jgi:pyrophosphatase PpaX
MKEAKRFRGVFFDWDGCLADTLGIWMELYKRSLAKRNIQAEERAIVRELFNDWAGPARFGVEDTGAFAGEIIRGLEQRVATVTLNPNVRSVLEGLRQRGKRTAILTGSKRSFVKPVLSREGIDSLVDLLVCLDDVRQHKPHPEAVYKALDSMGISQEQAIMVGDSIKDIEMGKNAGIATVLYFPVKNRGFYDPEWLLSCHPDFTIHDFRELDGLLE